MTDRQPPPPMLPAWALRRYELVLILGSWTVYGVVSTGQRLAYANQIGESLPTWTAAAVAFASAAIWALLTILIFSLSRRFPLDRRPRLAALAAHVVAGPVVAAAEVGLSYAVLVAMGWQGPLLEHFFQGFPFNLVVYWLIAGVAHGLMFYRRYRQRDAEAALLATRLAQAQLQVLKSQLHPHFLFNVLHTISALMHRDVRAADRMLARLSELLRAALEHKSEQEVTLAEELSFLDTYLEIERARLAERLTVEVDVPVNVLDALVPHMILQPLVENSIRHGIAPRAAPGHVRVRVRGRRNTLDVEVVDDGVGLGPGDSADGGLGLANARARLQQLYGEQFSFEARNRDEGGFRVLLSIPFKPAGDAGTGETG